MDHLCRTLSDWEAEEALWALRLGTPADAVAGRYGISTKTLQKIKRRAERRGKGGDAMMEMMTMTDSLTRQQLAQAYRSWKDGWDVGKLAIQLDVLPADLRKALDKMDAQVKAERHRKDSEARRSNPLTRLNDELFAVLDDLKTAARSGDAELVEREIRRAHATEQVGKTIIANSSLMLRVYEAQQEDGKPIPMLGQ